MSEALLAPAVEFEDAEAVEIDAIKVALASAEAKNDQGAARNLRDKLSEARIRRIGRLSDETWDALERLVGHRLRR